MLADPEPYHLTLYYILKAFHTNETGRDVGQKEDKNSFDHIKGRIKDQIENGKIEWTKYKEMEIKLIKSDSLSLYM